ncbi:hypothetical protein ACFOGJ_30215 [Marinibaculum pumilum]|uniref:Uncharacterized protein n=1 Tax=Marinibaculum pumilum TaxID=1766165 RepID=A0ABV7LAW4_9PROT
MPKQWISRTCRRAAASTAVLLAALATGAALTPAAAETAARDHLWYLFATYGSGNLHQQDKDYSGTVSVRCLTDPGQKAEAIFSKVGHNSRHLEAVLSCSGDYLVEGKIQRGWNGPWITCTSAIYKPIYDNYARYQFANDRFTGLTCAMQGKTS